MFLPRARRLIRRRISLMRSVVGVELLALVFSFVQFTSRGPGRRAVAPKGCGRWLGDPSDRDQPPGVDPTFGYWVAGL